MSLNFILASTYVLKGPNSNLKMPDDYSALAITDLLTLIDSHIGNLRSLLSSHNGKLDTMLSEYHMSMVLAAEMLRRGPVYLNIWNEQMESEVSTVVGDHPDMTSLHDLVKSEMHNLIGHIVM